MLRLAIAAAGKPDRLAAGQRLQDHGRYVGRYRQRDTIGAFDPITVFESEIGGKTALIAHDQRTGAWLHQRLPCIGRAHHAAQQFGVQAHDRPGESGGRRARRSVGVRCDRGGARLFRLVPKNRRPQLNVAPHTAIDQRHAVAHGILTQPALHDSLSNGKLDAIIHTHNLIFGRFHDNRLHATFDWQDKIKAVNGFMSFKDVSSEDHAGKWKVVFFWPKDFTFVCPTEIAAFGKRAGIVILVLMAISTAAAMLRFFL